MAKKQTPAHFSSVLDDETPAPVPATGKLEQLNFLVDSELKKRLHRAIFWKGKAVPNQKSFLAQVLKDALDRDPDSDRLMPGE